MGRVEPTALRPPRLLPFTTLTAQTRKAAAAKPFTVVEATIPEMQAALKSGRTTSREIVRQYLQRIGLYEDMLHAAITVNPKALEIAAGRDRERAAGTRLYRASIRSTH